MFTFFRKYQRFIYFIVTAVIILSFSFFGTYSAFTSGKGEDPVVFKTVAGKNITRSEFNDYIHFISMDPISSEGYPGNPLNDGVMEQDIISSPVGEALVAQFRDLFGKEWKLRLKREKQFQPYKHPQAPFISAQQIWSYFAPDVKAYLEAYQQQNVSNTSDLYKKKRDLYLAEKRFPGMYLRQILQYQQKQFEWVEPDTALDGRSLSLFGYQQVSDWFGQAFVEKSAEFIIQMAAKARLMGITISKDEVIASLYKNIQAANKQLGAHTQMSPEELMKKTLLSLGMDESRAIKVWGDILLCRRALSDLPQKIVLNSKAFLPTCKKESAVVDLEVFKLQPSLRLETTQDLLKVEVWLDAVSKKQDGSSLLPSKQYRSCEEVVATFPEFVERRFVLSVAHLDMAQLANQVKMKEILTWQNEHWDELVKEFPQLKEAHQLDREGRFQAMEKLSSELRLKADELAKKGIVASHPEWIALHLDAVKMETSLYEICLQGGTFPFEGIKDRKAFIKVLSQAPISEQSPALDQYTQDGKHFYRIKVLDRKSNDELVPLPDLLANGTLTSVLDKILEASYERIRKEKPAEFRTEKGTWKPFSDVKDEIAEIHFASFLKRLTQAVKEWKEKIPSYCNWNDLKAARVAVRFLPLISEEAECLKTHGPEACNVAEPYLPTDKSTLTLESRPLNDLFSMVKEEQKIIRSDVKDNPAFADVFSLGANAWLPVRYSRQEGPCIAKVKGFSQGEYKDSLRKAIYALQEQMGDEVVKEKVAGYTQEFFGHEKKDVS